MQKSKSKIMESKKESKIYDTKNKRTNHLSGIKAQQGKNKQRKKKERREESIKQKE